MSDVRVSIHDLPGGGIMAKCEQDFSDLVDEYADRIQRGVDAAALDKAAGTLAGFGYVKVVRCRDCKYAEIDQSDHEYREPLWCCFHRMDVKPGNFCAWAKQREAEPPIFDDERGRYYE